MHRSRISGFTLIELMIAAAVIAILAAIAIPNYLEQSKKGRRAEAIDIVGELQLRQERWRAENPSYATQAQLGTIPTSANYGISVTGNTATAYTITATRAGKQTGDRCGDLVLSYSAGAGKPTWSGDADCND